MINPSEFVKEFAKNMERNKAGNNGPDKKNASDICKAKGITFGEVSVFQNICECGSKDLDHIMERKQCEGYVAITKEIYKCKKCGKIYDADNKSDMAVLERYV